jgi:cytochrome P450
VSTSTQQHVSDFEWPSPELNQCPFPFYEALRREAPVFRYPGRGEFLVSRWEDAAFVEEHPELFRVVDYADDVTPAARERREALLERHAGEPHPPTSIPKANPPEHERMRALTLSLVHRDRLRAYEPTIRRIATELVDGFVDRGEVEFVSEFSEPLPLLVIMDVMGLPRADLEDCRRYSDLEGTGAPFATPERNAEVAAKHEEGIAYMERAILERQRRPRDDYLSHLVQAQVERDGTLAVGFLAAQAHNLLFAGNVTTTHMLGSAMVLLLEHPEVTARLRRAGSRPLLRSMLEEVLRLESPIQFIWRTATRDTEIGGVPIPEGSRIAVLLAAANRDEERFAEPDAFEIDRRGVAKDSLAFGRGIHFCLGAPLARLEGEVAFEVLFERLRDIRLARGRGELAHLPHPTFRAPQALHLEFDAA